MNIGGDDARAAFAEELGSWTVRGVLCALPSFGLAVLAGFNRPQAVAAMLLGVASSVGVLAWITSRRIYHARVGRHALGWALRSAANVRAGLALVALFWPDLWLGFVAYGFTRIVACAAGYGDIEPQNTFVATYVLTVVQGALIFLTIVLLAAVLFLLRAGWRRWRGLPDVAGAA